MECMKGENMSDIQKILNAVADLLDSTNKPETVSVILRTINRTLDGVERLRYILKRDLDAAVLMVFSVIPLQIPADSNTKMGRNCLPR
mgnify:CR=1 FL=1